MKSLQESLFDKDLVKKELTLRETSCILAGNRGIMATGVPIGFMFKSSKLRNYSNPYYSVLLADSMSGLLGIITDMSVPKRDTRSLDQWTEELKHKLSKYINHPWIIEFNNKVEINFYFDLPNKDCYSVNIDYGNGEGTYEFVFKWNK